MKIRVNSEEIDSEDVYVGPKTHEEFVAIVVKEIERLAERKVSREINKYLDYEGDGFYYEERVEEEWDDLNWNNIFEFEEEEVKT